MAGASLGLASNPPSNTPLQSSIFALISAINMKKVKKGNGNPCLSRVTLSRVRTSVCQVVSGRVVFGVVIGEIVGAFVPIEAKLALGFSTSEPMDSHANHLDAACDDSIIYESDCSRIVCLDG